MIKHEDAIKVARSLIGTPYSELDCINLIKKVIRTAPGGVAGYTTAGTNTLWGSIFSAAKYRDLTERHEGLSGVMAGALAFKRYGADGADHVGIVTGAGTVIHSSSVDGRGVVETPLTAAQGWDCWGVHRYIGTARSEGQSGEEIKAESDPALEMQVQLADSASTVNVRSGPGKHYPVIGRLSHGAIVTVTAQLDGWNVILYQGGQGYVSQAYLAARAEPPSQRAWTSLMDSGGAVIALRGDWRVMED